MKDIRKFLRKGVEEMEPYVPGKPSEEVQTEFGLTEIVKMASNENPWGASPRALEAMRKELEKISLYPEGSCAALRREMARKLGVTEEMITFSNGADNCILLVAAAFINEGDEVVMADPTFPVYETATRLMGGRPVPAKLRDFTHDLERMASLIGEKTKLVFVCNPNNPTGTIVTRRELAPFMNALPGHVLLVLDEAYAEFVSDADYPNSLEYIQAGRHVVGLRTFSKIYGLAGVRIGYALGCEEFVGALNRVREPFPVSRLAQAAAIAALEDEGFKEMVLRKNEEGKVYLQGEFERMGLPYVPSQTNFVLVDLKRDSQGVHDALLRKGIIVRPGRLWDLPTSIRVTIGTMEQNRKFITALQGILEGLDDESRSTPCGP
jgi:histidinol-phosphate aminotransferase